MLISKSYPGLGYDQLEGSFWRLKKSGENARRVFPDETGYLSYKCAYTSLPVKKLARKVAWEILYDCSAKLLYIVHRNLNKNDYRGYNLVAISAEEHTKFRDATYNLEKCHMQPTGRDAFSYTISYRKDGKLVKKTLHDVVAATRFKRFVKYCSLKYLGKYLNTI